MVLKKHVPYQDCHLEGYAPLMDNPKIYKVSSLLRHGAPKGRCAIPPQRRSAHVGAGPQGSWGDPKHQPGLKSKAMVPKISRFGGFP